ncbi:hypothetical protein HC928_03875 [bacterium]|nr:hypothetical protein [bacterium]
MPRSFRWVYVLILWCSLGGGFITARVVMTIAAAEHRSPVPTAIHTPTGTSVDGAMHHPLNAPKLSVDNPVYLPFVARGLRNAPPPPPPPPTSLLAGSSTNGECRFDTAGMFLGVRPVSDWNRAIGGNTFDFLCRVRGNQQNCPNAQNEAQLPGVWPAVVVLSNEVFNVVRFTERPCNIAGVNSEGRGHIYEYLAQASQRGIPIIIRLASPGNFRDAVELGPPHTLILAPSETPQIGARNRTYCDADQEGRDGASGYQSFRSIDDLLNEMGSILGFLDVDDRFNQDNIYFLPANEPNGEWYGPGWWTWQALYNESPDDLPEAVRAELPQRQFEVNTEGIGAWDDINRFFSALYRRKEERARNEPGSAFPLINILTPPIGQGQRAEPFRQNCADQLLFPAPNQTRVVESGYGCMLLDDPDTVDFEGMLQPALNDGYSWNNYWNPDVTRE